MGARKDENYVVIDYKGNDYHDCENLKEVEEYIEALVDEHGASEVADMIDDLDIVIIKGVRMEDVELQKTVKVKIKFN